MIGLYVGLLVYNLLTTAALALGWPYLAFRYLAGSRKWRERCGDVPRDQGPTLWIHAASMGEVSMIRPLLGRLKALFAGHALFLSTMTATGQERAREAVADSGGSFFFPLDFIPLQLRALSRLRPRLVILCETELWPNLIWLCRLRGIPIFLVNARLSKKSFPYYRAGGFLFRPLIRNLSIIACQTQIDLTRYARLAGGETNLTLAGNMKYDAIAAPPAPRERAAARQALGLDRDESVVVAGSTREGEEEMVLLAWQRARTKSKVKSKLIIAPRHPDRFAKVAKLLEAEWSFARRSAGEGFSDAKSVLLWDTTGELMSAYAVGDIAFVGGSLVPVGGHNPLEPAALGLPVVFGPYMDNAAESARILLEAGGAVQVGSAEKLAEVLEAWIVDVRQRRRVGISAQRAVTSRRGAAERTAEMIVRAMMIVGQNNNADAKHKPALPSDFPGQ